jgi:hypothetical protein
MQLRSFFRREDKEPERELGGMVGDAEPKELRQRFIHTDIMERPPYVLVAYSEDELVIDMALYKDGDFVGHIDTSRSNEELMLMFASGKPEDFATFCGGCFGGLDEDSSSGVE